MTTVLFIAAVVLTPLAFGAPLLRLRSVHLPARSAIAWAGGAVVLGLLLIVLAAAGLRWRISLLLVLAGLSVLVALLAPATSATRRRGEGGRGPGTRVRLMAAACCGLAGVASLLQFSAGAATSADLAYVWGPKAVLFALDRGLAFEQASLPHLAHLHPNYPPLWPGLMAWGSVVAGGLPWRVVPMLSWCVLVATAAVVHWLLRLSIQSRHALPATCLWFAVLGGSFPASFSGGNAEAPLLLFTTVAVATLVLDSKDGTSDLRWLAAGALAGAVLSKSEGAVAAVLIVVGVLVRDRIWRRPRAAHAAVQLAAPAVAAAALWAVVRYAHGLPLADPIREPLFRVSFTHMGAILKVCVALLAGGGVWLGLLVPLIAVAVRSGSAPWLRVLPGLLPAAGLPLFALVYYLHATGDPVELIVWTFPRLIQPALSVWIVSSAILCFGAAPASGGGARALQGGRP